MGHRSLPQRYLRNFEDPGRPGYTWVHDRRGRKARLADCESSRSRKFYSQATETVLAKTVERPANPVINKLTSHHAITSVERGQLSSTSR